MARKPLVGNTKLADSAQIKPASTENADSLTLVKQRPKPRLKNFRLSPADILRLQKITDAVNEESERPISETAVIKGLIALGEKITPERLLKTIREVW